MPAHLALPVASPGPLAGAISLFGLLAAFAWIGWRFGPMLLRITGWASWWAAGVRGTQGGYAYSAVFFVLGTLAWGAGTVWERRDKPAWRRR